MSEGSQWPVWADRLMATGGNGTWPSVFPVALEAVRRNAEGFPAREQPVGLAVSGGADSVCLALLAWASLPELRERLTVLHFNHRRRGADSDGDAAFVRSLADGLGVNFVVGQSSLPAEASFNEAALREERLAFFKTSGCGVILQGHQRDDILETMLMRLCRGSGLEGLSAPRYVSLQGESLVFLRPLLHISRDAIRGALRDCGIPWREDVSNAADDFLRNRIRHHIVPALREATGRDPSVGAASSHKLLSEDNAALNAWLVELYPDGFAGETLDLQPLLRKPRALLRRAFYRWMTSHGLVPERAQMDLLLDAVLLNTPTVVTLAGGRSVEVFGTVARLLPEEAPVELWPAMALLSGECLILPSGAGLEAQIVLLNVEQMARIMSGQIDSAAECYLAVPSETPIALTVRPWQAGDRFHALGAPGSRKVSDMFIDTKIPMRERMTRPLVCWDDEIVWIPGFPPVEAYRIEAGTEWALRLTYIPISVTL